MSDGGAASTGGWCTIESDPGVFTSLVESFGCRGAEFAELYSLDDDSLRRIVEEYGAVYGLIFLFKWDKELENGGRQNSDGDGNGGKAPLVGDDAPADLFFARQVTHNACATQAILSVLLNAEGAVAEAEAEEGEGADSAADEDKKSASAPPAGKLILGPTLSALRSFAASLPTDVRGEVIGSSDEIRAAHNSFARKDAFLTDPEDRKRFARDDEEGQDVFHFVAYVPHASGDSEEAVYELDGLNAGPVEVGAFKVEEDGGSDRTLEWISVARTAIQERIEKYAASEIKFNLMAVVRDRRVELRRKLAVVSTAAAEAGGEGAADNGMAEEASRLHAELEVEKMKRERWDVENERRRHNYLPFCVELIRALAGSGKLPALTESANERVADMRKNAIRKKLEMAGKGK